MFNYDSELPSGYQDADIEMAGLIAAGNRSANLAKKGICSHGWLQGPPGKSVATCLDCGKEFTSMDAARAEGRAILNGDDDF